MYVILRYEGRTLEDESRRHIAASEGGLSSESKIQLLQSSIDALSALHGKGVVHGDLKPNNLLIAHVRDVRNRVCIIDFGMSRMKGDRTSTLYSETKIAEFKDGRRKPQQWIAPELYGTDASARFLSEASDIYAMGIVWLYIISGWSIDIFNFIKTTPRYLDLQKTKNEFDAYANRELVDLIFDCFLSQPQSRPNSNTLKAEFAKVKSGLSGTWNGPEILLLSYEYP